MRPGRTPRRPVFSQRGSYIYQGVQRRMESVVKIFVILIFFCFVVALFDRVHDVETIHGIC